MRAVIITGGDITDYSFYADFFLSGDTVICADGGVRHLIKLGVYANFFIGDFDSCNFNNVIENEYLKHAEIIRFKCEKDETDTEIALNLALDNEFDEIIIIGAIGTRFDHTLANVLLLKKALSKNIDAKIINEKNEIKLTDKSVSLNPVKNSYLSLIALEEVHDLTLYNLKYPLENYALKTDTSICISNEFTDDVAEIVFSKGLLMIIISRD